MECEKRRIERKRADQLVYAELGPENGSILMNLSEDGCAFQSIAPVLGREVHFTVSLGTGRVIEGDARVAWTDDTGKLGGLQFTNRSLELRNHIRAWLTATVAAEDLRLGTTLAQASSDSEAKRRRKKLREEARLQLKAKVLGWKLQKIDEGSGAQQDTRASDAAHAAVAAADDTRKTSADTGSEEATLFASQSNSGRAGRSVMVVALVVLLLTIGISGRRKVGYLLLRVGTALAGDRGALEGSRPDVGTPHAILTDNHEKRERAGEGAVTPVEETQAGGKPSAAAEALPTRPDVENLPGTQGSAPHLSPSDEIQSLWGLVEIGDTRAEVALADRYSQGAGVPRNCTQARVLLTAAVRRGSTEAKRKLDELSRTGCP